MWQPGSIIGAGDLLATMDLKDPSKVKKILPFSGNLKLESKAQLDDPLEQLNLILEGENSPRANRYPLHTRILLVSHNIH